MSFLLCIPIIFPIIGGLVLLIAKFKERIHREIYVASIVIADMILSLIFISFYRAVLFLLLGRHNSPRAGVCHTR